MAQTLIKNIIRQLVELQEGSLWFDQCFRQKVGLLPEEEAFARSLPEVHSVAEHISHIIEWRKECLLRFHGQRTELMNSPDDWKDNPTLKQIGWNSLLQIFCRSTDMLVDALKNQEDSYLETKFMDTDYTFHYLIDGIIQHDLYHLGQIGVTLKLLKASE